MHTNVLPGPITRHKYTHTRTHMHTRTHAHTTHVHTHLCSLGSRLCSDAMTMDRWRRRAQRQERRPNVECLHCACVPHTTTLISVPHTTTLMCATHNTTHYSFATRGVWNTPPKKEEGSHARHTDTQGPTFNAYFAHTQDIHILSISNPLQIGKASPEKEGGIRNQIDAHRARVLLQGSHFICVGLFPYALVSFHMHWSLFVRIGQESLVICTRLFLNILERTRWVSISVLFHIYARASFRVMNESLVSRQQRLHFVTIDSFVPWHEAEFVTSFVACTEWVSCLKRHFVSWQRHPLITRHEAHFM